MRLLLPTMLAALALAVPTAVARSGSFVIQSDHKIGSYAVRKDGSLRGLIAAYGDPSRVGRQREICHVRWRSVGLAVTFYNLGGANPCEPAAGRFSQATMTGTRWRTSVGLRVGDRVSRLRALYRQAKSRSAWWWLVTRRTPFGDGGSYPGLAAKVQGGRVTALRVAYPAGGD